MRIRRFWGFLLLAGRLAAQQYPFLPVAGSPRNIESMIEDREGRLWLTTHDDVLCFDEVRFFSLRESDLPPSNSARLVENPEGGILIGSEHGIYRFYQGRLEHVVERLAIAEMVSVAPDVFVATASDQGRAAPALFRIRATGATWQVDELAGWKIGPT